MSETDPQQEWNRLAERYREFSKEELLQVASDLKELTDLAREVLAAELKARRLSATPLSFPEAVSEMAPETSNGLVEVGQFTHQPQAVVAKASLESAGIAVFLFDETMSKYAALSCRLFVMPEDLESATEILSQPILSSFEVEGVGLFEQPRCPKCNSLDTSYGMAIPDGTSDRDELPDEQWWCLACGARWEDDDSELDTSAEEEPQP
jgi:hypothetical protein